MGSPHNLAAREKVPVESHCISVQRLPSHSGGGTHLGGSCRTLLPPLSEVWAPVTAVVIDDPNIEPGDRKLVFRRDNIKAMYQTIELGQVLMQEEDCDGGEDCERVGFIDGGGSSTEFNGRSLS